MGPPAYKGRPTSRQPSSNHFGILPRAAASGSVSSSRAALVSISLRRWLSWSVRRSCIPFSIEVAPVWDCPRDCPGRAVWGTDVQLTARIKLLSPGNSEAPAQDLALEHPRNVTKTTRHSSCQRADVTRKSTICAGNIKMSTCYLGL